MAPADEETGIQRNSLTCPQSQSQHMADLVLLGALSSEPVLFPHAHLMSGRVLAMFCSETTKGGGGQHSSAAPGTWGGGHTLPMTWEFILASPTHPHFSLALFHPHLFGE